MFTHKIAPNYFQTALGDKRCRTCRIGAPPYCCSFFNTLARDYIINFCYELHQIKALHIKLDLEVKKGAQRWGEMKEVQIDRIDLELDYYYFLITRGCPSEIF